MDDDISFTLNQALLIEKDKTNNGIDTPINLSFSQVRKITSSTQNRLINREMSQWNACKSVGT